MVTAPAETITESVEVLAVPQVCLAALDDASDLAGISADLASAIAVKEEAERVLWSALELNSADAGAHLTYLAARATFDETVGELFDRLDANSLAANSANCREAASQ